MNKESVFVQAEREKLQGAVSKLSQEKGLVELRLRSYEAEKTRLAPTLEETQWEVSRLHDHAVDSRLPATSGPWGLLTSLRGGRGHPRVSTHVCGPWDHPPSQRPDIYRGNIS